jgi:hypothetical protein
MSEPRRLLEDDATDFERALLRSARHDGPSPALRDKTLLALGLGVGVVGLGATTAATATAAVTTTTTTATATATTTTGAAAATATAAAAKHAAWAGSSALLKWIGLGVVGGALTVTAVVVAPKLGAPNDRMAPSTVDAAPTSAKPAGKVAAGRPSLPEAAAQDATEPSPPPQDALAAPAPFNAKDAKEAPVAGAPTGASAEAARRRASIEAPRATLTEEIALLDRAREAVARGSASSALAALDEHDRTFPGAALGPEATVLRVEALSLRGDRPAAVRLGRAFLAAHPESPHASRLRSLLGAAAAP